MTSTSQTRDYDKERQMINRMNVTPTCSLVPILHYCIGSTTQGYYKLIPFEVL
jgi:hypothetical protein